MTSVEELFKTTLSYLGDTTGSSVVHKGMAIHFQEKQGDLLVHTQKQITVFDEQGYHLTIHNTVLAVNNCGLVQSFITWSGEDPEAPDYTVQNLELKFSSMLANSLAHALLQVISTELQNPSIKATSYEP